MDYKKVAIISSVGIVALGIAVIGAIAWRARQPDMPAEDVVSEVQEASVIEPSDTGKEAAPVAAPDNQSAASEPARTTATVDASAEDPGCDTKVADTDCDFDHLTNAQERSYKTDPLKSDTDSDGLSDVNEIFAWKSDPLNPSSISPPMNDFDAVNVGKRNIR